MKSISLNNCNIVYFLENENIKKELIKILNKEDWTKNSYFLKIAEIKDFFLNKDLENFLIVIIGNNILQVEKTINKVLKNDIQMHQIIVGCPSKSPIYKILDISQIELFHYEEIKNSKDLNLNTFPSIILKCYKKIFLLQLEREIKNALDSGALILFGTLIKHSSIDFLKERAHLAHSLGESMKISFSQLRKLIKLALFSELVKIPEWENIVTHSRYFWEIKDLLIFFSKKVIHLKKIPEDTPIEIIILLTIVLLQETYDKNFILFQKNLLEKTKELPKKTQTLLDQHTKECFKILWNEKNI